MIRESKKCAKIPQQWWLAANLIQFVVLVQLLTWWWHTITSVSDNFVDTLPWTSWLSLMKTVNSVEEMTTSLTIPLSQRTEKECSMIFVPSDTNSFTEILSAVNIRKGSLKILFSLKGPTSAWRHLSTKKLNLTEDSFKKHNALMSLNRPMRRVVDSAATLTSCCLQCWGLSTANKYIKMISNVLNYAASKQHRSALKVKQDQIVSKFWKPCLHCQTRIRHYLVIEIHHIRQTKVRVLLG